MFCKSCGSELSDGAVFCMKCGTKVTPVTSQGQGAQADGAPEVQSYGAQQAAPEVQVAPQPEGTPVAASQYAQQAAPQYGQPQVYTTSQRIKKKKKKWPIVLAIVLCVVLALGAVAFSMRDTIKMLLMPEEQAKAALRASSASLKESVMKAFDSDSGSMSQYRDKAKISYIFGVDKATVAGSDYLSYVKAKAAKLDMEYSVDDKVICGTIGVLNDTGSTSSVLDVQFYMDKSNAYVKVPALFGETLSVSTSLLFSGTGVSFEQLFDMLSSGKTSSLQQYIGLVEPVVNDVLAALDSLIDDMEYEKVGRVDISGSQGSVTTTQFAVTVTAQNIRNFLNTVVDNIYADESLKAILALASGTVSKDMLKNEIAMQDFGFEQMKFYLYVTDKAEVARVTVNSDDIADYYDDRFEVDLQFVGKSSIYDEVILSVITDDAEVGVDVSTVGSTTAISFDLKEKGSTSKNGNDSIHIGMNVTRDGSTSMTLDTLEFSGTVNGNAYEVAMSGSISVEEIGSVSMNKSNFSNVIDVTRMTTSQSAQLTAEIIKNISVFKNIMSDEMYNNMYKSMFGSSSTYGFY